MYVVLREYEVRSNTYIAEYITRRLDMIGGILIATCVVAGVGIVIGIILGIADMKLHVDVDEKEAAILEALPGNNCGGCGFPGCSGCDS